MGELCHPGVGRWRSAYGAARGRGIAVVRRTGRGARAHCVRRHGRIEAARGIIRAASGPE
ncbi:hypothetical protein CBM2589_B220134 [Cupriavidus taiwanensis]|uniref:Uncharacterized protein n=1 Tax=Cupriavidus taiwanensis TaxID=164546 RepID=A0A375BP16_9BURK|nr:hypothetical protein CBM2589_B220134 [Cupriavidus taiwanensis]